VCIITVGGENMSKNYFMSGITDLLVLAILSKGDRYMYEIVKCITDFSKGKLEISQNTIYTVAYKLGDDGKISEYSKLVGKRRTRVYYHLEPKGKEYLNELMENFSAVTDGVFNLLKTLNEGDDTNG